MKTLTLRSLLTTNIKWYMNEHYPEEELRFKTFLRLSEKDHRIAVLAQGYYISLNKFLQANEFEKFTHENFKSISEYLNSDTKYALEFKRKSQYYVDDKIEYLSRINKIILEYGISHYAISKGLNIPQQNISSFFNKNKYNTLSNEKLQEILKFVTSIANHKTAK